MSNTAIKIPKHYLFMLNQIFEIEQKASKIQEQNSIQRNIDRFFRNRSIGGESRIDLPQSYGRKL